MPLDVLSLDLGASLGWAMARNGVIVGSGIEHLGRHKNPGDRYIAFHNFLSDFRGVDEVIYEHVAVHPQNSTGNTAAHAYGGYLAVTQMFCAGLRIPLHKIHLMTIKAHFAGHGRAEKEDICQRCHDLGWAGGKEGTRQDHDEADACAMIFVRMQELGIEASFA